MAPLAGGPKPKVSELAEALGFIIERVELPQGMSGRLLQDPEASNAFRIQIRAQDNVRRQRWSVLHEIGHWVRHIDPKDPFSTDWVFRGGLGLNGDKCFDPFYLDDELDREREADEFAAAVFFDGGALEAAISLFGRDAKRLADHFGLSEAAINRELRGN